MFEVGRVVHHLLKLMLGVLPDGTLDGVNKSLGFAQVSAKEGLESLPADRDVSLVLYLMLVLLPADQGGVLQEGSRKWNLVQARGTGGSKVIFILLEEIIALQMRFIPINIREPSFQRPLTWAFIVRSGGDNGGRNRCKKSRIQNGPKDPLEVIFQVSNHKGLGRARNSKWSDNKCNSGSRST